MDEWLARSYGEWEAAQVASDNQRPADIFVCPACHRSQHAVHAGANCKLNILEQDHKQRMKPLLADILFAINEYTVVSVVQSSRCVVGSAVQCNRGALSLIESRRNRPVQESWPGWTRSMALKRRVAAAEASGRRLETKQASSKGCITQ
jgi:hypothetical protein